MMVWMNHKLESRLLGEISPTSNNADDTERVTGRKARGLQMEEIGCKCPTFFISLLSGRRKETTSVIFFPLLYTNLKRGFS